MDEKHDRLRCYKYVGPSEIANAVAGLENSVRLESLAELIGFVDANRSDLDSEDNLTATYVIDQGGKLRLAPRRSEHVACAVGEPVLSAGEITFVADGTVVEVSNQSTGYCPEPESWPSVATALDRIGVPHPGAFTSEVVFRRCESCGERSIVKDDWFVCELCGSELPAEWNFGDREQSDR